MEKDKIKTNKKQKYVKEIRKNTNKLTRGILIYELIMFLIVTIDMIRRIPFLTSDNELDSQTIDKIFSEAINSGTSSIIAVILGVLFLTINFRKYNYRKLIVHTHEKMTGLSFLVLLTIFMSVQFIFSLSGTGIEACLNHFGLSIQGEIESASSSSITVSMLLYASFIGPITEEIVFRGFVMRGFQKYGTFYGILMSSIIFGAFHGNLIQSFYAILVGLVLGYVAMKYSLKWSIILHIINNFVFGDLLSYLIANLSEFMQSIIIYVIEGGFFVGTIAIIILKRNEIKKFIQNKNLEKGLLGITFTSIWLLIFLTIQILLAISCIEKLPV